ncbi:MAG: DnaA/Hda family protein [Myxococcota bacterium]
MVRRLGADMDPSLLTWIEPLLARFDDDCLTLGCPTGFHRDRVRDRFLEAIEAAAAEEAGRKIVVNLLVSTPVPEEPPEFRVQDVPVPPPALGPRSPRAGEMRDDTAVHDEASHDEDPRTESLDAPTQRRTHKVPPERERQGARARMSGAPGELGDASGNHATSPSAGEAAPAPAGGTKRSHTQPERPPAPSRPPTTAPARPAPSNAGRGPRETRRRAEQRVLPYRFDNFIVGGCNALAREACLAVAQGTQSGLNPLVLAAPSGLGKTHLARAMFAEARRQGETRAIYASAEAFTTEFTTSLRAKRVEQFKRRYRMGCKLLVLEDMQFLDARKKATQLEIFHTVSHLLDVGAQVVLTADRQPCDIEGLDPRLRSTLTQGVVAELHAPDAQVRRDILRAKAADGGVRLPEECRELIVESVRGNVRDLEGVLIQLVATASLLKRPIDTELTLVALRKLALAPDTPARLEPGDVIDAVAAYFQKRPDELAGRSGRHEFLIPRQLAMYLCRKYTDATLTEIAKIFGRDHSSASNAVRKVERQMLERAPMRYKVEALSRRLDALVKGRG